MGLCPAGAASRVLTWGLWALAVGGEAVGGAEGVRTPDPRLAKPMLSQLSYSPGGLFPFAVVALRRCSCGEGLDCCPVAVGLVRVELTTSRLSGVRSNHLSYRPAGEAPWS